MLEREQTLLRALHEQQIPGAQPDDAEFAAKRLAVPVNRQHRQAEPLPEVGLLERAADERGLGRDQQLGDFHIVGLQRLVLQLGLGVNLDAAGVLHRHQVLHAAGDQQQVALLDDRPGVWNKAAFLAKDFDDAKLHLRQRRLEHTLADQPRTRHHNNLGEVLANVEFLRKALVGVIGKQPATEQHQVGDAHAHDHQPDRRDLEQAKRLVNLEVVRLGVLQVVGGIGCAVTVQVGAAIVHPLGQVGLVLLGDLAADSDVGRGADERASAAEDRRKTNRHQ